MRQNRFKIAYLCARRRTAECCKVELFEDLLVPCIFFKQTAEPSLLPSQTLDIRRSGENVQRLAEVGFAVPLRHHAAIRAAIQLQKTGKECIRIPKLNAPCAHGCLSNGCSVRNGR